MKQINLFTSNRLEILVEKLAEILKKYPMPPMTKEIIIVQSKGMERWLSMELARHHRICANIRFPFPNAFVYDDIFQKILPDVPEQSSYDVKIMTWKLMKILPDCIANPIFGAQFDILKNYLKGSRSLKLFQLSECIADTFDQYLVFRPEMIFDWERGKENHWQALLWRELVKGNEGKHQAGLAKAFFKAIRNLVPKLQLGNEIQDLRGFENPAGLTEGNPFSIERICVFGISALPRFHMDVFDAISLFVPVNLFLMNPCAEYWGDILSKREKKWIQDSSDSQFQNAELYTEAGNSLLASMGTLGRDFFDLISELSVSEEFSDFEDPCEETDSLLLHIQSDILNLRERETHEKEIIDPGDTSVQIHSCHSPMREAEVLHDRLLEMFENDPKLMPGDILVMMPDIETYAPYIQAVFDMPAHDPRRIPFSIADRGIKTESRMVETFLNILELTGSRFKTVEVLSILESPGVYQKFDLSETDLELVRTWIRDTRICWGIDEQNRHILDLPGLRENTWKAGIERLLLGYAMPDQEDVFANIFPYDCIEGNETLILGNFLEFTRRLFFFTQRFSRMQNLKEWTELLKTVIEVFFDPEENTEHEFQLIRQTLNELADMQDLSGFDEPVDIDVIKCHLHHHLDKQKFGFGFITGSITFCAMLPMRSIPFKVICLMGMNDNAYPNQSKTMGFDLMAKHPKPGDRSRRNDDRYLFLESVLSARKKLYISYVGQNIQDNSLIPPSVLVSELTDYIENNFEFRIQNSEFSLLTSHRLQAFSPAYFRAQSAGCRSDLEGFENLQGLLSTRHSVLSTQHSALFSYSQENCEAARCILNDRKPPVPFISKGLSEPEPEWKTVNLTDLCFFYTNPTKFLLNKRLGIYLETHDSILEEKEIFDVGFLDKYIMGQYLMEKKLDGKALQKFMAIKKAAGELPHGTVGECTYEKICGGIEAFAEKIKPHIQNSPLKPLETLLLVPKPELGNEKTNEKECFTLTGRIDSIYPDLLIQYRCATVKPKDHLRMWIHHLILNSQQPTANSQEPFYPKTSILAGTDAIWEYQPVENSEEILETLLERYWQGLKTPLHFFPNASWKYVEQINKHPEKALKDARFIWRGDDYKKKRGENEDVYYQMCFRHTDPVDSDFEKIAIEIFEPLMAHCNKIS